MIGRYMQWMCLHSSSSYGYIPIQFHCGAYAPHVTIDWHHSSANGDVNWYQHYATTMDWNCIRHGLSEISIHPRTSTIELIQYSFMSEYDANNLKSTTFFSRVDDNMKTKVSCSQRHRHLSSLSTTYQSVWPTKTFRLYLALAPDLATTTKKKQSATLSSQQVIL